MNDLIRREAAIEAKEKPTGEIRTAYDLNNEPYLFEASGTEAKRFIDILNKVGDTVWVTSAYFRVFNSPVEAHLKRIEINGNNSLVPVQLILFMDIGDGYKEYGFNLDGIGKIIFLTREEAEAALSKGEKDDE